MTFLNITLSLLAALAISWKLAFHAHGCSFGERLSMAMIASAMMLNIGPIVAGAGSPFQCPPTPFDDWGSAMLRVGLIGYFLSRLSRHWRRNRAQLANAREFMRERGR